MYPLSPNRLRPLQSGRLRVLIVLGTLLVAGTLSTFLPAFCPDPPPDQRAPRSAADASQQIEQTDRTQRRAFMTLLSGGKYAVGAAVLAHSLRRHHPAADVLLRALVLPQVCEGDRRYLRQAGWEVVEVAPIANPHGAAVSKANWAETYSKLRLWEQTDVDKVVFVDADMIVLRPMAELFEHGELSAALECCDQFNTGMMVLEPSTATFRRMMQAVPLLPSYDHADGGFLNSFFPAFRTLSFTYNALQPLYLVTPLAWDLTAIRALHFMGPKPWLSRDSADADADAGADADIDAGANDTDAHTEDSALRKYRPLHRLWWNEYHAALETQPSLRESLRRAQSRDSS